MPDHACCAARWDWISYIILYEIQSQRAAQQA